MTTRKPTYFTSDWHLGHNSILSYSNRPFNSLEHMHATLISNFNEIVPTDAITYFLGDIGLTKGYTILDVISQLHGTKVLIIGNHDKGAEAMYKLGFDVVLTGASMIIAKQLVTMSHCPLIGVPREDVSGMRGSNANESWHGESRPSRQRLSAHNHGQFHLHGHIHSPNSGKSKKILDRQYDVGVDANKYRPVHIKRIESWIAKTLAKEKLNNPLFQHDQPKRQSAEAPNPSHTNKEP